MTPVDLVVQRLSEHGCNPRRNGGGWSARCPAHDDHQPSLSVSEGADGRALLHCHTGCTLKDVLAELELSATDLFPKYTKSTTKTITATYDYTDEHGALLFQTVRYEPGSDPRFLQRRPDGKGGWVWNIKGVRRVLYRLPAVREAKATDDWVVIPEGEKDAERLAREGICATTSPMGAGKWDDGYADLLAGTKVAILPDNDKPGREHAERVARSLQGKAQTVRVVELPPLPEKGDVSDWLDNGGTAEELKTLITEAQEWEPSMPVSTNGHGPEGVYLVRADQIPPEHVTYFDEGLIPLRVVTVVSGLDGVGKSTVLYTKAAMATRGKLLGAFYGSPVNVVIASTEDHPGSVIVPRLVAAGADLSRVHVVKIRRDGIEGEIALPEDLPAVAEKVREVDARLLIIDPLVAHLPLHVDSHKAQHVRSVMAPAVRLAEDHCLAVCAVVHFNGAPSNDVRTRISGSKALRDSSRSVLVCGPDPSDESRYVLVQDKNSFGPKPTTGRAYRIESRQVEIGAETFTTSGVVWLGEVEVSSRGLLAGAGDPEERTERDEAADFLRAALVDCAQPAAEVKKAAAREGITERTLHRARRELHVVVQRSGFPGTTTWSLPVVPLLHGTTRNGTTDGRGTTVETQWPPGTASGSEPQLCHHSEGGTTGEEGTGLDAPRDSEVVDVADLNPTTTLSPSGAFALGESLTDDERAATVERLHRKGVEGRERFIEVDPRRERHDAAGGDSPADAGRFRDSWGQPRDPLDDEAWS
jgi:putative DNA primase/helicase